MRTYRLLPHLNILIFVVSSLTISPAAKAQSVERSLRPQALPPNVHPYVISFPPGANDRPSRHSEERTQYSDAKLAATLSHQAIDVDLAQRINELMQIALARSPEVQEFDKALSKYTKGTQKGKFGLKDIGLNYLGLPRGFDSSEEGAHVILNQAAPVKNLEAAAMGKQLKIDRTHEAIVRSLLQLALGLGCPKTSESQSHMNEARATLDNLVGREESDRTVQMLVEWTQAAMVPAEVFEQRRWNLSKLQKKSALASELSFEHDPLVLGLRTRLHRIGDHSKSVRVGSKVLEGTVSGLTMFGPGLGVPIAAQAINAGWGVANGGSEEAKLLKEIYFQKQLESREHTLKTEALTILLNYREALETRNLPLLICSEALIAQLVGAVGVPQVLDCPVLAHGTFVNHSIESAATERPVN